MNLYAKGIYCPKIDCDNICLLCDTVRDILNVGNVEEGRRYSTNLLAEPCDLAEYKILQAIKENSFNWVENGENLFIYSATTGNGKSAWANKIMLYYACAYAHHMCKNYRAEVKSCVVRWANVAQTLDEFRKEYAGKDYDTKLAEQLISSKLVIWDDLGSEVSSKWVLEKLYINLNSRLEARKSNIITSNLTPKQMLEQGKIDIRIYSRLKSFTVVELVGSDRRGQ